MIDLTAAESAAQYLLDSAPYIADAQGEMERAEKMLGHVLALVASQSDASSEAARDREAKASPQYAKAIEDYRAAVVEFRKYRSLREAAEARISIFQTMSANQRGFERGARATM